MVSHAQGGTHTVTKICFWSYLRSGRSLRRNARCDYECIPYGCMPRSVHIGRNHLGPAVPLLCHMAGLSAEPHMRLCLNEAYFLLSDLAEVNRQLKGPARQANVGRVVCW